MGSDNFQKGEQLSSCSHCGEKGENIFVLVRHSLDEINTNNLVQSLKSPHHRNHQLNLVNTAKKYEPLHRRLGKNIFGDFDKSGTLIDEQQRVWVKRLQGAIKNPERNEGLLEVMHFLGAEVSYNRLLHLLPIYEESLNQFFAKCYQDLPVEPPTVEGFRKRLLDGRNPRTGTKFREWFTDLSKNDAVDFITQTINDYIRQHAPRQGQLARTRELTEMANSIYTSLSTRGGDPKPEDWEENYTKNSPLSVLKPKLLQSQFRLENFYEGVEYCSFCGAEQSRSLRYNGKFVSFQGAENELGSVIEYDGRLQDLESEVLPHVKILWQEQIKEFKRRDRKATKMWDTAEDRLQKKLDKEKERIRKAEIAKLEKKLKKLQNGD